MSNTWTHRDLLRLSHPKGVNPAIGDFVLNGKVSVYAPDPILGFKAVQAAKSADDVARLVKEFNLPWEAIPTQFLKDVKVWKAIFYSGNLKGQALVRNITRLARLDAFSDLYFASDYAKALTDVDMIRRTRLHPINYLNAIVVHERGQADRNGWGYTKDWNTNEIISDVLEDGFYAAFKAVEPANKRTMLAIDVSGSMSSPALGLDLSCAQVAGAVAMTVARTEPAYLIRGFTRNGGGWNSVRTSSMTDLGITARTPLASAMNKVQAANWGGTDCALPMLWALENDVSIDTFVVITDNDTWAGNIHPFQALKKYRKKTGIDARLAVLGTSSTGFTIADPTDRGMMDFVGFDSNAPRALTDFSAGRI